MSDGAALSIQNGSFTGNFAENGGGAFFVENDALFAVRHAQRGEKGEGGGDRLGGGRGQGVRTQDYVFSIGPIREVAPKRSRIVLAKFVTIWIFRSDRTVPLP